MVLVFFYVLVQIENSINSFLKIYLIKKGMIKFISQSVATASTCSAMESETISKNGVSPKNLNIIRSRKNFLMWGMLLFLLSITSTMVSQVAPAGQFIVYNLSTYTQIGNAYNNSLEAVYKSSQTNNSGVKNDMGTTIYKHDGNSNEYWKFQGETFIGVTTSQTDANYCLSNYGYSKSYVFKGNGAVYGVRAANAADNQKGTNDKDYYTEADNNGLIELDASYVYKKSVSRSDLSKMTATLDLSQMVSPIINESNEYKENLYIYGFLSWQNYGNIDLGFIYRNNRWEVCVNRSGGDKPDSFTVYPDKYISKNSISYLEWRIEDSTNSFSLYVNGSNTPLHSEYVPVSWARTQNPYFMMATTMCPIYDNDNNRTTLKEKRITNFKDGAFFGPVKWKDCKIHLTGGTIWNFWREDSHNSIYCNDHTVKIVPHSQTSDNSEIITISRTGSFSTTYNINTSSSPSAGGSTSGGGTKTIGTSCTITATPYSNYSFTNWTENGNVVYTGSSYQFTVTGDRNLVANFIQNPTTTYTITTSSNPTVGGTTNGGGIKTSGSSCTVVANANSGYSFSNWTENGNIVSSSSNYTFTVTANRTLVANFTTNTPTPPNNLCSNATLLSCGTPKDGTLAGATTTAIYPDNQFKDVFYKFTATHSGSYTITLTKYSQLDDIDLQLFSGCSSTNVLISLFGNGNIETITYSLTAGTTYFIRVLDINNTGANFTIKIAPPIPLGVSASQSGSSVNILWNSVANATRYEIHRSSSASGTYSYVGYTTAPSTSYTHTSPQCGNNYYKVLAQYGDCSSDLSNSALVNYNCSYTVTYNYNGATGGNSATNKTVTYNSTYGSLPNPTKQYTVTYNYNGSSQSNGTSIYSATFGGWFKEAAFTNNVTSTTTVTTASNHYIYAKWTNGTALTLPTPNARTGYTFNGWYNATSGGSKIGNSGESYTPTADVNLYAKWTANTYQVKFNANGGNGTMNNQSMTYDQTYNLTANAFTRTNYAFDGWATSESGSVVCADGASVSNLTSTNGETFNLYAKWTVNTITPQTCGDGTDNGVIINDVKWATRNVCTPGTFAENSESAGMFYQWNRKVGWSSTDPMADSNENVIWDTSQPTGTAWTEANDPCPTGWRVPTSSELNSLNNTNAVWTQIDGVNGYRFGSDNNTVFLPASGGRDNAHSGQLGEVNEKGWYWSSSKASDWPICLYAPSDVHYTSTQYGANGMSVRCVAKSFTINTSVVGEGSILPSGTQSVFYGDNPTFTFTPDFCYEINQVLINDVANSTAKANGYYTFPNVTANQTISVTFSQKQVNITPSVGSGGNGNISPSSTQTVNCGDSSVKFDFIPNQDCSISQVLIDGFDNTQAKMDGFYTFPNVTENHTIFVYFSCSSGIDDVLVNQLQIYPNPAKNELFISSELQINKVEIYTITGSLLLSDNNFNGKISVSALPQGV